VTRLRARHDSDTLLADRVGRSIRLLNDSGHPIGKLPTPMLAVLAVGHHVQFNLRVAGAAARYIPSYLLRRKSLPSLVVEAPRKILVVISGNLGDCVMATRTLVAIHDAWPAARIGILTNHVDLFRRCPFVDRCLAMPDRTPRRDGGLPTHPLSSVPLPSLTSSSAAFFSLRSRSAVTALVREIADEHYDIALMAHNDTAAYLAARAGIPVRIGHTPMYRVERALKVCLTHPIPSPSLAERYADPTLSFDVPRYLGVDAEKSPRPQLWPDPAAAQRVRARLAQWGVREDRFAVIHTSARSPARRWPDEHCKELVERLNRSYGWRSVWVAADSAETVTGRHLVNATGQLPLDELIALIDLASGVVTTDSGPLHIAGVLERPIVGLFRSRNPVHERRYETLSPILGRDEACRARCGVYRCRGTNPHLLSKPCAEMSAIVPDDVLRGFERMGMAPGAYGVRPPV
jgi:ADP-heptose:LPS heptosyltransferase